MAQSEVYVEYSRTGQVVRGQEPAVQRSKYQEDGMRLCQRSVGQGPAARPRSEPGGRGEPGGARARARRTSAVYPNNHPAVWGSYWEQGRWGYACCGQFIKNSFCTGAAGFAARKAAAPGAV